LKYAAKDAKALAGELEQRGQGLFQSIHIQPLLDRKVTLQNINTAFSCPIRSKKTTCLCCIWWVMASS
jgi:hypothetical protein